MTNKVTHTHKQKPKLKEWYTHYGVHKHLKTFAHKTEANVAREKKTVDSEKTKQKYERVLCVCEFAKCKDEKSKYNKKHQRWKRGAHTNTHIENNKKKKNNNARKPIWERTEM